MLLDIFSRRQVQLNISEILAYKHSSVTHWDKSIYTYRPLAYWLILGTVKNVILERMHCILLLSYSQKYLFCRWDFYKYFKFKVSICDFKNRFMLGSKSHIPLLLHFSLSWFAHVPQTYVCGTWPNQESCDMYTSATATAHWC